MRVFLTGATGFLGSRVLSQLEGHELLCLVRNPQHLSKLGHGRSLVGDLAHAHMWQAEVERFAPQWCVHLAWERLPDYSLPCCRTNLNASIQLIEVLADAGVQRVVTAGTCWEYGNASGAVRENSTAQGFGLFAATKHALRMVLESFGRDRGIDYRWARVFFAYGPGQRAGSLIPICHAAYSRGQRPEIRNPGVVQDFIYADDVAEGIAAVLRADGGSGIFNIGSGIPTRVADVVNRVAKHFGAQPPFSLLQAESGFWADTSRTTAATGWKAQTSIDDGITQTLRALDSRQ